MGNHTPTPTCRAPDAPTTHFHSLLTHITHSTQSLATLHKQTQSELSLLAAYFSSANSTLAALKPLAHPSNPDAVSRAAAVEARRKKWAEMEAMEEWKRKVEAVAENVRRREEVEGRLRGMLREIGEVMVEREVLEGIGEGVDAVL